MKAKFYRTKAGNGFKILVDSKWLYASKDKLLAVINGDAHYCQFGEMDNSSEKDEGENNFQSPFNDDDSSSDESQ